MIELGSEPVTAIFLAREPSCELLHKCVLLIQEEEGSAR